VEQNSIRHPNRCTSIQSGEIPNQEDFERTCYQLEKSGLAKMNPDGSLDMTEKGLEDFMQWMKDKRTREKMHE